MGFFDWLGNAVSTGAEWLGSKIKSGYETLSHPVKHINKIVGKVARGVQGFASNFDFMSPIGDFAGLIGDGSDLVSEGFDVADNIVNKLERSSKEIRNVVKGNSTSKELSHHFEGIRNDVGNFNDRIRNRF